MVSAETDAEPMPHAACLSSGGEGESKSKRETFPSSEASTSDIRKATSLPNWRSLIGDPALAQVGETEKKKQKKYFFRILLTFRTPSANWRWRLVTSPFSGIFIFTIPGVFIDRGLRSRTSRGTRSAVAKTPVDEYAARNRVNKMAENGDVINFTPTAQTEEAWVFFSSFFFSYAFLNQKERGNINQGPRIRQGSRFPFFVSSLLLGNFAQTAHAFFCFANTAVMGVKGK